jgi:4-diphosphocytidyl-2-C-methyl-D-erythritol kinase
VSYVEFTLPAFAKINWELRILGRRLDNLHELQTIFQTVTLSDYLSFSSSNNGIVLDCKHPDVPPDVPLDQTNLIYRAALLLREKYRVGIGARISLDKRIPLAAGLGGGSSDAAITLLGLAKLWELDIKREELLSIASLLGADVPFFLYGGTAIGLGTGTDLFPINDLPISHILIINPGIRISTAEAYQALNAPALTKEEEAIMLRVSRAEAQIQDSLLRVLHNDFEPAIFSKNPEIEHARDLLIELGANGALMAGSGSSLFGLFEDKSTRDRATGQLESIRSNWSIFPCETLTRVQYRELLGMCAAFL